MARFYGKVGFGVTEDAGHGVQVEEITERSYYGDVIRNVRVIDAPEKVTFDLSVNNSISIVADAYANEHFFAIRYVEWSGSLWIVDTVEVQRPRLLLRLGGVYDGPRAEEVPAPEPP